MPHNNKPPTGEPRVLASYQCDEGTRQLVAQRIDGTVALSDLPTGEQGKVYLVERQLSSMAELEGIAADYVELSQALGRPALRADWIFT
jgi:hypothetical protein